MPPELWPLDAKPVVRLVDAIRCCVLKEMRNVSVEAEIRVTPLILRECREINGKYTALEVFTCGDYL